jgi:hypothetical protein
MRKPKSGETSGTLPTCTHHRPDLTPQSTLSVRRAGRMVALAMPRPPGARTRGRPVPEGTTPALSGASMNRAEYTKLSFDDDWRAGVTDAALTLTPRFASDSVLLVKYANAKELHISTTCGTGEPRRPGIGRRGSVQCAWVGGRRCRPLRRSRVSSRPAAASSPGTTRHDLAAVLFSGAAESDGQDLPPTLPPDTWSQGIDLHPRPLRPVQGGDRRPGSHGPLMVTTIAGSREREGPACIPGTH